MVVPGIFSAFDKVHFCIREKARIFFASLPRPMCTITLALPDCKFTMFSLRDEESVGNLRGWSIWWNVNTRKQKDLVSKRKFEVVRWFHNAIFGARCHPSVLCCDIRRPEKICSGEWKFSATQPRRVLEFLIYTIVWGLLVRRFNWIMIIFGSRFRTRAWPCYAIISSRVFNSRHYLKLRGFFFSKILWFALF